MASDSEETDPDDAPESHSTMISESRVRAAKLHETFKTLDAIGFGVLTSGQFYLLGRAMHRGNWTQTQSRVAFDKMDADNDGFISRADFIAFYMAVLQHADDEAFEAGIARWIHSAHQD